MCDLTTDRRQRGWLYHLRLGIAVVGALLTLCLLFLAPRARAQVQVLTHHNDNSRTGANLNETILNTTNVNIFSFGKLFSRQLDGDVFAQPLYVPKVAIPRKGVHNVIYVATANNTVYAYDADDPLQSQPLWYRKFFNAVPGSLVNSPWLANDGIIGTPVIAAATNPLTGNTTGTIYVVTCTLESQVVVYRMNALDITTGAPVYGSSVVIAATIPGTGEGGSTITFNAAQHIQRPALLLQNGFVYAAFGSHDDIAPWHGWIFGYNSQNLQAPAVVFNTTPNGGMGAIWQSGAGLVGDAAGNIYCMTGNGSTDASSGGQDYAMSMLKLSTGTLPNQQPALSLVDWFMPYNALLDSGGDLDLGSGGPMLLPGTNLLVGGGKNGVIYVVNTANMGHYNAADDSQIVQSFLEGGNIFGNIVYWNSPNNGPQIYVWDGYDPGTAYKFANGKFVTTPISTTVQVQNPNYSNAPGMSISANGSQSGTGILWTAMPWESNVQDFVSAGVLRAFDATNLKVELWNSNQMPARDGGFVWSKFCPPTVANGKVYLATYSNVLNVYGLVKYTPVAGTCIGVHFGGELMGSSETAGVIPQQHWNSPPKANVATASNLLDSTGTATNATLSWQTDGTYAILFAPDLPGNFRMMWQYLDTIHGNPTTVTVTGLPVTITAHGYDVYVYTADIDALITPAAYTLGNTTLSLNYTPQTFFDGIFIPAVGTTAGNYLEFPNQTGSSFTITATPGKAFDNTTHAPVNAIQIVAHPQ